jgi:hypothetical protein
MKFLWPRPGQMPRLALLVVVALTAVGLTLTLPAMALPTLTTLFGGQLYYTGGDVTIDILDNNSVFNEILWLRSGSTVIDVANGSQVGSRVTLTKQELADLGIGLGDELQFGIHVQNTSQDFVLGPGSRNADGIDHAYVRSNHANGLVGFEDLFGGGDRDYNDTIFRFSGVTATAPHFALATTPDATHGVPEPAPAILLLTGIGLLGIAYRRR